MCAIWSFINCLLSGLNTAPLHATAKNASTCSAQLNMNVATRWSPVIPNPSNACANAAARAAISANVVSCITPDSHVVTLHLANTVAP